MFSILSQVRQVFFRSEIALWKTLWDNFLARVVGHHMFDDSFHPKEEKRLKFFLVLNKRSNENHAVI